MSKEVNSCFKPFKDIHKGMSAAVMGCGPTLNLYDGSKNLIHVGCNELLYSQELSLDYHFVGDSQSDWPDRKKTFAKDPKAYNDYSPNISKFVRDHPQDECSIIQANKGRLVSGALHYDVATPGMTYKGFKKHRQKEFQKDILSNYMYSRISITWEMMQFILWTGVSRIYLMGHDCSYREGTVHNPTVRAYGGMPRSGLIEKWKEIKVWIEKEYPNVDVACINPDEMRCFKEVTLDQVVEN